MAKWITVSKEAFPNGLNVQAPDSEAFTRAAHDSPALVSDEAAERLIADFGKAVSIIDEGAAEKINADAAKTRLAAAAPRPTGRGGAAPAAKPEPAAKPGTA